MLSRIILAAAVAFTTANAMSQQPQDPKLPFLSPMFGSHMVLQRDRQVPVWGWTAPGAEVSVAVNGKTSTATAGADGRWEARVGPLKAGGPYTVSITGPQSITLDDVLAGDVWLCSGQSNMEMGLLECNDAEREAAAANYPDIRLFNVEKTFDVSPRKDLKGEWLVCTPENIRKGPWAGFTAAGYYFGRELHRELGVPIGLIQSAWGGTVAESWTGRESLLALPDFVPDLKQLDAYRADPAGEDFPHQVAQWMRTNDPGSATDPGWGAAGLDTTGWKTMRLPTRWEDAGMPDYDGVVWFRREFELPAAAAGRDATLNLGVIDDADTTWVNGVKVGETDGASLNRSYKVPGSALRAGTNSVAVRVMDYGGAGGFTSAPGDMTLTFADGVPVPLAGDWSYNASADLYRSTPFPKQVAGNVNFPTMLFNGMIAPVIPFGIKGAIWYQGESNAARAYQYRTLLPAMIADWRKRWNEGDFPFLIVQLAAWMPRRPQPADDPWAELREAQEYTAQTVKNAGLATAIDIGDAVDIHPKNKQEVGRRLALVALRQTYGIAVEDSGPLYRSMKVEGGAIRLTFDHVGDGWVSTNGAHPGFAIAGPDRKFVWADAKVDGDTVLVSSPGVPNPVAVRYAWESNPEITLFNGAGLPMVPFRTDDWPGITAPKG